jgi:hypothetical protein
MKIARCSRELAPQLARNLGRMAEDLDSTRPLDGAKNLFAKAFGDTADENWRKRKRYIRITDGEVSAFDRDGEYVSAGVSYVKLAEAYADLIAPSEVGAKSRAIRRLVKGTELDPLSGVDLSQMDGLTQVADLLGQLQDRLASDQVINKALEYLDLFPIAPFGPGEIPGGLTPGHMGSRVLGKGYSIVPNRHSTLKFFDQESHTLQDGPGFWFEGRVFLGWLFRPRIISRLILPLSTQELVDRVRRASHAAEKETAKKKAAEEIDRIIEASLEEQGLSEFRPGREFTELSISIPDKLKHTIYYRMRVFLIFSRKAGKPELALWITPQCERTEGDSKFLSSFNYTWACDDHIERTYSIGDSAADDLLLLPDYVGKEPQGKSIYFDEHLGDLVTFEEFMEAWDVTLLDVSGEVHVIGNYFWESSENWGDYESAPVNSGAVKDILVQGSVTNGTVFRSGVWDDYSRLAPAPQGSVAGTILRNLAYAPKDKRIDTLLFEDVRQRLQRLPEFVDVELARTCVALDSLKLGSNK